MSAYVVVELTVKDPEAKDRYSTAAGPVLKEYGGEFIAGGAWDVLTGEPAFTNGAIIRFADRETATAWYNSPGYQATFGDRALGIDCRFRLLG
ncbi:DUF1330 domain-containing protein [Rhizobium calliandrae]|uniref:DUF1330 domain-containing protein n=2 Tax=Rhizobium TaxID=379 RepID=A0A387FNJ1_9HYPH|nr:MULTISPECIES: DUF1330 domain-containing protein [Rhizobium]AYG59943.1 DUF1330 domain-containing protein [Rhizobium jaguaris]MDL2406914.1 DUF1330 domain-containing protein [Rhizobium calliandrae]